MEIVGTNQQKKRSEIPTFESQPKTSTHNYLSRKCLRKYIFGISDAVN